MLKHYRDYFWKKGKPFGKDSVYPENIPFSYKIVADPYYKRISIEKYEFNLFKKVVYDSILLDFRHLTLKDQIAWQREMVQEDPLYSIHLLRNQEDRVILFEKLSFEEDICKSCHTYSAHGISLAFHKMFYTHLNDSFNGVILYDAENRPVMIKTYEIDPETKEFTTLLSEEWEMEKQNIL